MSSYYTYKGNLRDRNKFTSTVDTTFGTKRYFSSLDTEVYFGSSIVDEIVAIDFTISEPKLPIYGFNSFYANRIISGRRTIQGTFAINFTNIYYLINILNEIDDSILKSQFTDSSGATIDYESLLYRCEGEDSTGLGIGNNALFSKMFDITLSYGYGKSSDEYKTYGCCYQTLVGVQITDYRQALDTEGNPILDMYSFIAKDIQLVSESKKQTTINTNIGNVLKESTEMANDLLTTETSNMQIVDTEYITANKGLTNEISYLNSKCQNGSTPGYIVNPVFDYDGSNNERTLTLEIDSINDNSDIFTDVEMFIYDQANGINRTLSFDDIKKGSSASIKLTGDLNDLSVLLNKLYGKDNSYRAQCVIRFMAKINKSNQEISHATLLLPI